jgi:hypothetical protein
MMKYGWIRYTRYGIHEPRVGYGITLWKQPLSRWLLARAYHWYSMRIYKVSGFKKLEKWLWKWYDQRHDGDVDFIYVPISNRQDLRCHYLHENRRQVLVTLDLTKEQYEGITADHGE